MLLLNGGRGLRELTMRETLNLTYAHLSTFVPDLDMVLVPKGSEDEEKLIARQNQQAMARLTGGPGFIPPPPRRGAS